MWFLAPAACLVNFSRIDNQWKSTKVLNFQWCLTTAPHKHLLLLWIALICDVQQQCHQFFLCVHLLITNFGLLVDLAKFESKFMTWTRANFTKNSSSKQVEEVHAFVVGYGLFPVEIYCPFIDNLCDNWKLLLHAAKHRQWSLQLFRLNMKFYVSDVASWEQLKHAHERARLRIDHCTTIKTN